MKLFNDDFSPAHRRPTGMTVPEGFFDNFQQAMEQQIDAYEAARRPKVHRTLRLKFVLWVSAAACLGLLVGLALPKLYDAATLSIDAPAADEYAEADGIETQEQLEQDVMLASLSDYDIFEYYYESDED